MKQAILLAVIITATIPCFSRLSQPNNRDNLTTRLYSDSTAVNIPAPGELLLEIMSVTGLQPNFELKEANVMNIEASISHRKRYILYNPDFISRIYAMTKDKWGVLALLAHEVGHHLNGHTIHKTGSTPSSELEADEFAGFILFKLGASPQQSQEVMKYIATTEGSATHPGRNARIKAIQTGWNKAATGSGISIAKN